MRFDVWGFSQILKFVSIIPTSPRFLAYIAMLQSRKAEDTLTGRGFIILGSRRCHLLQCNLSRSPYPALAMVSLLNAMILHALALTVLAEQYHPSALGPRSNSSVASLTPAIEAKITSPTGDDVTSGFQILLYESPKEAVSNLTDRQVVPARTLNFCESLGQTFLHSHCNYHFRQGDPDPLRKYIIYCRERFWNHRYLRSRIIAQSGTCREDEVCVDGAGGLDRSNHNTVAKCVSRSFFKPIVRQHTVEEERELTANLRAIMAVAILTQTDGTTPLSVSKLELDAGIAEERQEGLQSNQTCTDCFTLATSGLPEGIDFLKTQATLSAVGAVTAGVMYLAALSG